MRASIMSSDLFLSRPGTSRTYFSMAISYVSDFAAEFIRYIKQILTVQILEIKQYMGCSACGQICGNSGDVIPFGQNSNGDSHFLGVKHDSFDKIVLRKAQFIMNQISKEGEVNKSNSYEFISNSEFSSLQNVMKEEVSEKINSHSISHLEAGEPSFLSPERRTLWKIFAYEPQIVNLQNAHLLPKFQINPERLLSEQSQLSTEKKETLEKRFYEIDLDIKRTFPNVSQLNRKDLELLLRNLTLCFDGVGYTQGMNFVAGFLLLVGFSPQQSYHFFIHLSFNPNFLIVRNFQEGFASVLLLVKVLESHMTKNKKLNGVKEKIEQFGLTAFFYSFSWFLCYFLYTLNPRVCVIVWDFLLTFRYPNRFDSLNKNNAIEEPPNRLSEHIMNKRKANEVEFQIISNQRGSIVNVIMFAIGLLHQLSDEILAAESAEQILATLRNQNLAERVTEEIATKIIDSIYSDFDSGKKNYLLLSSQVENLIQGEDKDLYLVMVSEQGFRKYANSVLGLQRSK